MEKFKEFKNLNIFERVIDDIIENILEDKYRDIDGYISDIRYCYYGDANEYYSYSDFGHVSILLQKHKCLLSECTYNYLEEKIKNIFEPYVYYLKMSHCIPREISFPSPECQLCVYYNGCGLDGDSIEFSIGLDLIALSW